VRKLLEIALGILSAIGGFVDIGDLVASTGTGARFGLGRWRGCCWWAWSGS
jgi:manganese transport protein